MEFRRRLGHRYLEGADLFVTWHLYGSLPRALYPPPGLARTGRAFVWMDRYLDQTPHGPHYLRMERVATVVEDGLQEGEAAGRYRLIAYVLMSNHVHALLTPMGDVSDAMKRLKGATARVANLILARTGEPFWQRESYDHWVRGEEERERIRRYIERNPVKAGIVREAEDYRWSSAWRGHCLADQGPPAC